MLAIFSVKQSEAKHPKAKSLQTGKDPSVVSLLPNDAGF
jgi:hypothetical protein